MDEKIDVQSNTANSVDNVINKDIAEINKKIDALTSLAEENQMMVRNLYQRARMATVFVFIKWFIIIGITVGSFYYIQPLINNLVGVYGGLTGGTGTDLFNLIKSI
jgi:hypothetical protein